VGQILPRACNTLDLSLTTKLSFSTYLASNASYLRSERAELIDHRVDSVLQLKYLAFYVYCDLLREVTLSYCRRHLCDVSHLIGEVVGHQIYIICEVFPDT